MPHYRFMDESMNIGDVRDFRAEATRLSNELDGFVVRGEALERTEMNALLNAVQLSLAASAASLGECRRQTPYSSLYPLIDSDGAFKWCCTHPEPHCST
jgi:hypothetical protein